VRARLLVRHPPTYAAERRYVLGVVLGEVLGLEWEAVTEGRADTEIALAGGDDRRLRFPDGLFGMPETDWLSERSLPREPVPLVDGVPALYGDAGRGEVDLLGSAFFLLTRYEELVVDAADRHGRYPAAATVAGRGGFLDRALVHEYADVLWESLVALWPSLERRRHTFAIAPSHDVDWPLPVGGRLRGAAADLVRHRDAGLAGRRLRGRNVNDTFDWIMDVADGRGLRSAFYFIAGHRDQRDGNYSLDDPFVRGLLRRIHERGHEIGLHPSYTTFDDDEQLRLEWRTLRRVCEEEGVRQDVWGGRQHFLRFRSPGTWQAWTDAGLAYDSTVGFAETIGFRAGICIDYPVFNLRTRTQLALRERPLIVMERAPLERMGPPKAALERVIALRETCRRHGGTFTILWHNNFLVSRAQRRLYEQALGTEG
jgi:uncharacterized protein DUF7033